MAEIQILDSIQMDGLVDELCQVKDLKLDFSYFIITVVQLHWFPTGKVCDVGANAPLFRTALPTFVEVCK